MTREGIPGTPLFREVQYFRQWWFVILVPLVIIVPWFAAIQQLIFKKPFGSNPGPDWLIIIIWVVLGVFLPLLLLTMRLITEVRSDGLHYRFAPLQLKMRHISPDELASFEAVSYRPIRDYGGWGIRYGKKGWAMNVSVNRGVMLHLTAGKDLLIGSQRADELAMILSSIM